METTNAVRRSTKCGITMRLRLVCAAAAWLVAAAISQAGAIAGRILDTEGKPVVGAEISVRDPATDQWTVSESGAGGRFVVSGAWEGRGKIDVLVRREGFADVRREGIAGEQRGLDIVMRRPGALAGRVVGPDGVSAPAGEIVVNVFPLDPELASQVKRVTTGTDGAFRVAGLWDGAYDVVAVPRSGGIGLARAVVVPQADALVVRMPERKTLRVKVLDARGAPLGQRPVRVRFLSERWTLDRLPPEEMTTSEGIATFEGIGGGAAIAVASAEDGAERAVRFDLSKQDEVTIRTGGGGAIDGKGPDPAAAGDVVRFIAAPDFRLISTARDGRAGFRVAPVGARLGAVHAPFDGYEHVQDVELTKGGRARVAFGGSQWLHTHVEVDGRAISGPWIVMPVRARERSAVHGESRDGTIRAAGLASGRHWLLAHTGAASALIETKPIGSADEAEPIVLTSFRVRGRLVTGGEPAAGGLVFLVPGVGPEPPIGLRARAELSLADADGRFELPPIAGGPWRLAAYAPGYAPAFVDLDGKSRDDVEVKLDRGARLAIVATGPDGVPVLDAVIGVRDAAGRRVTIVPRRTGEDGRVEMRLAPGSWSIEAWTHDLGRTVASVKLKGEGGEVVVGFEGR